MSNKRTEHISLKRYSDILTVNDMCSLLGISIKTGYRLIKTGEITALKVGRSYRIPKIHVMKYLRIVNRLTV